jgi:hypothetical protein
MHFLLAAALSVVFAAIVVAAPAMDIKARQSKFIRYISYSKDANVW